VVDDSVLTRDRIVRSSLKPLSPLDDINMPDDNYQEAMKKLLERLSRDSGGFGTFFIRRFGTFLASQLTNALVDGFDDLPREIASGSPTAAFQLALQEASKRSMSLDREKHFEQSMKDLFEKYNIGDGDARTKRLASTLKQSLQWDGTTFAAQFTAASIQEFEQTMRRFEKIKNIPHALLLFGEQAAPFMSSLQRSVQVARQSKDISEEFRHLDLSALVVVARNLSDALSRGIVEANPIRLTTELAEVVNLAAAIHKNVGFE